MAIIKSLLRRNLSLSFTFHEWLIASSCFSIILLFTRMAVTSSLAYGFLAWNLFLAFIPYTSSWWMVNIRGKEKRLKLIASLFIWLLFVPNCFYIITDLFHLDQFESAPKWFDLVLILSFAWNGILCGIVSLRRVEIILTSTNRKNISIFMVYMVMWLNAFGIYIGRYLRYNSWDIFTDPVSLLAEIMNMMIHPFRNFSGWAMVFCFSIFMTLIYYTTRKMSESFNSLAYPQTKKIYKN